MAAKECNKFVYSSYTPASTTFIQGNFSNTLWQDVWDQVEAKYGVKEPQRPKRKSPETEHLRTKLLGFRLSCEFIIEFPSFKAQPCSCEPDENKEVLRIHGQDTEKVDTPPLAEPVDNTLTKSISILADAYNLLRRAAEEIVLTSISDTNRDVGHGKSVVHAVPIHYALSGYSLRMVNIRNLLLHIVDECFTWTRGTSNSIWQTVLRHCYTHPRWKITNHLHLHETALGLSEKDIEEN